MHHDPSHSDEHETEVHETEVHETVRAVHPDGEIDDPIGSDVTVYQSLAVKLRELIGRSLEEKPVV